MVPCVDDTAAHMLPCNRRECQPSRTQTQRKRESIPRRKRQAAIGTYVSAQFPLSQVLVLASSILLPRTTPSRRYSPILVAFRILMARSASVLFDWYQSSSQREWSGLSLPTHGGCNRWMSGDSGERERQRGQDSRAKAESGQRERDTRESAGRRKKRESRDAQEVNGTWRAMTLGES